MSDSLLLPPEAVLLHIGPYKTGSTSIQMALHQQRDELAAQGVIYPGTAHRQRRPGWAVLGHTPRGRKPARIDEWNALSNLVRQTSNARVCISTEDFGRATAAQARRIVADLGVERVHVVTVARRLDRLLPSQWQERIKTCHETRSYVDWLEVVLGNERSDPSARAFWASHDLPSVLRNWTSILPPEQLTLVATDDSDRQLLIRTFEQMLGLGDGSLKPPGTKNTSLTEEKVELLRALNQSFDEHGWGDRLHMFAVESGAKSALLKAPSSPYDQSIPPLPRWAADRVRELSEERVEAVKAAGVQVVGDLDCLRTTVPANADEPFDRPVAVSIEAASLALEGAIGGAARLLAENAKQHRQQLQVERRKSAAAAKAAAAAKPVDPAPAPPPAPSAPNLDSATGPELVGATAKRAAESLRRLLHRR